MSQKTIRQTLGGVTRISVLGWTSEKVLLGAVLNKAAEYKTNFKWNKLNPDQPPKPLCIADELQISKAIADAREAARRRKESRPTFKTLWDAYNQTLEKSLAADRSRFDKHLKDFHDTTPEEIFPLDIDRLKKKLGKAKLSPQTIKHCLTLLTRIVNYGVDQQRCRPQNKCSKVFRGPRVLTCFPAKKETTKNGNKERISIEVQGAYVKPGKITVPHPKKDFPAKTLQSIFKQAGWKE